MTSLRWGKSRLRSPSRRVGLDTLLVEQDVSEASRPGAPGEHTGLARIHVPANHLLQRLDAVEPEVAHGRHLARAVDRAGIEVAHEDLTRGAQASRELLAFLGVSIANPPPSHLLQVLPSELEDIVETHAEVTDFLASTRYRHCVIDELGLGGDVERDRG